MNENVRNELEKMIVAINNGFNCIINDALPTKELIELQFSSIRNWIDYCESLALNGEEAIETL